MYSTSLHYAILFLGFYYFILIQFFPGTANYRGGSGSSPDSTGAAEDTLTGCCVSTPSSEALDQVSDLRHSRTLPKRAGIISNENVSSNGLKVKETY